MNSTIIEQTKFGIYTLRQAANLLSVRTDVVGRWIYGTPKHDAALVPQVPSYDGDAITFLDLVQAMAIREIRRRKHVSLQKIRRTVEVAAELGLSFPFAVKHRTFVFRDDVVIRLVDDRLIQATGKYHHNQLVEPVVYRYLEAVGFDSSGLAYRYTPIRSGHRSVILTPTLNYGAPTVSPCGYTVATLVDAVLAEGDKDRAADVCGVNRLDVELAFEYEAKLAA